MQNISHAKKATQNFTLEELRLEAHSVCASDLECVQREHNTILARRKLLFVNNDLKISDFLSKNGAYLLGVINN